MSVPWLKLESRNLSARPNEIATFLSIITQLKKRRKNPQM